MLALVNARPIDSRLLQIAPQLCVWAGRDRRTGRIVFPCPNDAEAFEQIELPQRGVLWSYTVQRFAPKSPPFLADGPFEPFAIGYVELPGVLIIESRLIRVRFEDLRVGLALQVTSFALRHDEHGPLMMFAFQPGGSES